MFQYFVEPPADKFSLYVYSISVALQALTVISMGGIADHRKHLSTRLFICEVVECFEAPYRKRILLGFALAGASSATVFLVLPSTSPLWMLSAFLAIAANVGFGASVVAMNAYLPALAKDSPEVAQIIADIAIAEELDADVSQESVENQDEQRTSLDVPLIQRTVSAEVFGLKKLYDEELSRATSRISSFGIALGYGAGIFMLIIALIPVTMLHGSTFALRLAIGLSGIWWALFSIPAALWLPGAGGPSNGPTSASDGIAEGKWSLRSEVVAAWKRLGRMLRWSEILKLRNTFKYLAAWFLLSDGMLSLLFSKVKLFNS